MTDGCGEAVSGDAKRIADAIADAMTGNTVSDVRQSKDASEAREGVVPEARVGA